MAFVGWFGPRGLASVVFALIALEDLHDVPGPVDTVVGTIGLTVLLSVLAHGLSARPLAGRYGRSQRRPAGHRSPRAERTAAGVPTSESGAAQTPTTRARVRGSAPSADRADPRTRAVECDRSASCGSGVEDLALLGLELGVGQDAGVVQRAQLLELGDLVVHRVGRLAAGAGSA